MAKRKKVSNSCQCHWGSSSPKIKTDVFETTPNNPRKGWKPNLWTTWKPVCCTCFPECHKAIDSAWALLIWDWELLMRPKQSQWACNVNPHTSPDRTVLEQLDTWKLWGKHYLFNLSWQHCSILKGDPFILEYSPSFESLPLNIFANWNPDHSRYWFGSALKWSTVFPNQLVYQPFPHQIVPSKFQTHPEIILLAGLAGHIPLYPHETPCLLTKPLLLLVKPPFSLAKATFCQSYSTGRLPTQQNITKPCLVASAECSSSAARATIKLKPVASLGEELCCSNMFQLEKWITVQRLAA